MIALESTKINIDFIQSNTNQLKKIRCDVRFLLRLLLYRHYFLIKLFQISKTVSNKGQFCRKWFLIIRKRVEAASNICRPKYKFRNVNFYLLRYFFSKHDVKAKKRLKIFIFNKNNFSLLNCLVLIALHIDCKIFCICFLITFTTAVFLNDCIVTWIQRKWVISLNFIAKLEPPKLKTEHKGTIN